jgi:hypothetical protein
MSRIYLVPVLVLLVCMVPVITAAPWTSALLLVPAALALRVLRVGVDIDDDGITVRSVAGRRLVRWPELAGIRVTPRGGLRLVTTSRTEIALPVLRSRDLPRLASLTGGRITVPQPPG